MRSSLSLALRSVIVLMRAGRLLSVMQSDLDIQLLLDVKYDYVKKLRQTQAEMELRGAIVVDQLTVARNYVLVNAELFGGAQEKRIPLWTMNENDPALLATVPLFAGAMPLPDLYTIQVNYGALNSVKMGK
jgi:hypothetical protein